jgi:hypothetical protein
VVLAAFTAVAWGLRAAAVRNSARSPYVAQTASPVRGLSAREVDDLLNGRGAGFARSAELNGYPGPRHVLDLDAALTLSPSQRAQVDAIFARMQAEAKRLGAEIVERERHVSGAFAAGHMSPEMLSAQTRELGLLYAELRATHLRAHLQTKPILTKTQVARYNALRGYGDGGEHEQRPH